MCGACLLPCNATPECASLSEAAECIASIERVALTTCEYPPASAFCDVPCESSLDCEAVIPGYVCANGFCRATAPAATGGAGGRSATTDGGAGGEGGAGGRGGAAGNGGEGGVNVACSPSGLSGDQIVVLGDVFVAQTQQVTFALETLAHAEGALASTESYRDYSSVTENALAMGDALLRNRYEAARAENPISVVIMNGGGADMLMGTCDLAPTPDCQLMVDVVAGADQLLSQMATDGVDHVVWFYYPDPMEPGLLSRLNVLGPLLQDVCENASVPCVWVELQPVFEGYYAQYMATDFVPSSLGAQAAASTIWSSMKESCVAQ